MLGPPLLGDVVFTPDVLMEFTFGIHAILLTIALAVILAEMCYSGATTHSFGLSPACHNPSKYSEL